MIFAEVAWFKKNSERYLSPKSAPVLNLGSSTLAFRTKEQPFMEPLVMAPIEKIVNAKIIHSDIKKDSGVDLAGDIYDVDFQKNIIERKFKTIICSNLLLSVSDPRKAISIISSLVVPEGLIFITTAERFPYSADPEDNFFRPTPGELFDCFDKNNFMLLEQETVLDESYVSFLSKRPTMLATKILRICTPFYHFSSWRRQMSRLPNYLGPIKQSCIVVRRLR